MRVLLVLRTINLVLQEVYTRIIFIIIGSNTRSYISWDLNFLYIKKIKLGMN